MRQLGAAGPDHPCQQSLARWRNFNLLSRRAKSIEMAQNRSKSALKIHFYRVRVLFFLPRVRYGPFFTRFTEVKVRPSFHILVHT